MSDIKSNRPSKIIYQVYPATFKDSNNDGIGDINGITEEVGYISRLDVDALWISPITKSLPGAKGDGGYAVLNYREIDPKFGTMEDFERLLEETHKRGLEVYMDFVMCHTASQGNEWFEKSRNREPGLENRYVWHPGNKDHEGKPVPPNNWKSVFGGPAWTFDEKREEFYLHHFNSSQPALNGNDEDVQAAVIEEMKFWLDKGVDGLRLDAMPYANYDPEFRDNPLMYGGHSDQWNCQFFEHSIVQPQTIKYVERIREAFDSYGPEEKISVGEIIAGKRGGLGSEEVAASYTYPETGVHTAYTEIKFWSYPSAQDLKRYLRELIHHFPDGANCNTNSNHDFSRASTRMMPHDAPEDLNSTIQRQLLVVNFSMPGSVCIFQGEELGLPDARIPEDIPYDKIKDELDKRQPRDIARAPIPWNENLKNAGFSSSDEPYLPVPESYYARAVNSQENNPYSMLTFTRALIADRKTNPAMQTGVAEVLETHDPIFAFTRENSEQTMLFAYNMGGHPVNFTPSEYLDEDKLTKMRLNQDTTMLIDPHSFSRRGLTSGPGYADSLKKGKLGDGHNGTRIFTTDLILADVFDAERNVNEVVEQKDWKDQRRVIIDRHTHEELKHAESTSQEITAGGSTLITMMTLMDLQKDFQLDVDFLAMVANDLYGSMLKDAFHNTGISLHAPKWPENVVEESPVSHIIKTEESDIVATYPGTASDGFHEALQHHPELLDEKISGSDVVFLSGSLTEKFGQSLTDEILRLRWKYKKELVLSLPIHANFGPHDAYTFRNLVRSANIVTGNDYEFCRIYDVHDAKRPTTNSQMEIVTRNVQNAFQEEVLLNNNMPCLPEPVAFITRGDQPALIVTKYMIAEIPVSILENAHNSLGSGDVAAAAFIDGVLRGLEYELAANFAVKLAAEKVAQPDMKRYLNDPSATRDAVLQKPEMAEIAEKYHNSL